MEKINKILILSLAIFLFSFSFQVIRTSRLASTVGEVHLLRDRQILSENKLVSGNLGRLTANKWLVSLEKTKDKILEVNDLNIVFFAGHPNERADVKENERLPWLLLPFLFWGLVCVLNQGEKSIKVFSSIILFNLSWAISYESITDKALRGTLLICIGLIIIGMSNAIKFLRTNLKKIKK